MSTKRSKKMFNFEEERRYEMESIAKNQQRLETVYSTIAYELTGLQAKYAESQRMLEQTACMLKLAQRKLQEQNISPVTANAATARTGINTRVAHGVSDTSSDNESDSGSMHIDTAVLQTAPVNARTRYTGLFCDLVYGDRQHKLQSIKTSGVKAGLQDNTKVKL